MATIPSCCLHESTVSPCFFPSLATSNSWTIRVHLHLQLMPFSSSIPLVRNEFYGPLALDAPPYGHSLLSQRNDSERQSTVLVPWQTTTTIHNVWKTQRRRHKHSVEWAMIKGFSSITAKASVAIYIVQPAEDIREEERRRRRAINDIKTDYDARLHCCCGSRNSRRGIITTPSDQMLYFFRASWVLWMSSSCLPLPLFCIGGYLLSNFHCYAT